MVGGEIYPDPLRAGRRWVTANYALPVSRFPLPASVAIAVTAPLLLFPASRVLFPMPSLYPSAGHGVTSLRQRLGLDF